MNHLEKLMSQYYDWQGYIVKTNVHVGKRKAGGYEGELDVVAYHPENKHLIHIECSTDAHNWEMREQRFKKKFETGRKHIIPALFPWLTGSGIKLEQMALLALSSVKHSSLAGGKVISVDAMIAIITQKIKQYGKMSSHAIPENYDLLRTIQLVVCGYMGVVK
ncbi:MAG: hypothetical protein WC838_02355 [Candidatus Margulisiibacteriota bacterium]|jgi:hypothetical protein